MNPSLCRTWKKLMETGLIEDGAAWDWTTQGVLKNLESPNPKLKAYVVAKSEGVWAAEELVHVLQELGDSLRVESHFKNGMKFKKGDHLVELQGNPGEILALERPFLNLAAYVCGVATQTEKLVSLVKAACPEQPPRVTLTRKTLPEYRDVGIHGVICGGGFPHRVSLSGGILIKENHIAAAGGIAEAIQSAKSVAPHGLKVEIEVRDIEELTEALQSGAEVVMLDNFTPHQVEEALQVTKAADAPALIEVSGGIHEKTISDYAKPGVHILSIGSLTHSVQAADLSLLVQD